MNHAVKPGKKEGHWLFGVNVAREALRSGRTVYEVYIYRERADRVRNEIISLATKNGVRVRFVEKAFFSGFPKGHQGVAVDKMRTLVVWHGFFCCKK